ncbi:MAG: type II toxin-antitoxin system RelE/ParE family toxin [Pseudomonadota bacterium]
MKHHVRLSNTAKRDLARLEDFLVEKSPHAARRASEALRKGVLSLEGFPGRGAANPETGARELPIPFGNSAYMIRYLIQDDTVLILRIFHAREGR